MKEEFPSETPPFFLIPLADTHHSRLRSAVTFMHILPLLLAQGLKGCQLLHLQPGIEAWQLLGRKLVQLFDHIFQFVAQSVSSLRL